VGISIYDGFRFKSKRTREFLVSAHTLCFVRFGEWIDPRIGLSEIRSLPVGERKGQLRLRLTELESQMRMAAFGGPQHAYYAECYYWLFAADDGYTYGWDSGPFTPAGREIGPYVEEYSFWEGAARPEDVTQTEWRERRRTWKKTALDDYYNGNKMVAPIVSFTPMLTTATSWLWVDYFNKTIKELEGAE